MARRFNALLRERGILKGEQKYYISLAHTDDDIQDTIAAWEGGDRRTRQPLVCPGLLNDADPRGLYGRSCGITF